MKVLIVPNYAREDAIESARRLEQWLDGEGVAYAAVDGEMSDEEREWIQQLIE